MRAKLIIACGGLLLVAAALSQTATADNLLVDPNFTGNPPLNTDANVLASPFITGQWGARTARR